MFSLRFSDQNIVTLKCKSRLIESLLDFMRSSLNEVLFCLSIALIQRRLMKSSFKWHIKNFQTILYNDGESYIERLKLYSDSVSRTTTNLYKSVPDAI